MVECYFTICIFLSIPFLNSCLNIRGCFYSVRVFLFIYLVIKIIILSIIIDVLKKDFSKEWEDNICENIKSLTFFSYIWNIIMVSLTGLYLIFCIISCYSDYDEDDYERDYGGY